MRVNLDGEHLFRRSGADPLPGPVAGGAAAGPLEIYFENLDCIGTRSTTSLTHGFTEKTPQGEN
jgi:hypothetical protein